MLAETIADAAHNWMEMEQPVSIKGTRNSGIIDAPKSDIFDAPAYVRFILAPLAWAELADAARSSGLAGYESEMHKCLNHVLQVYEAHGIEELSLGKVRDLLRIRNVGTNDDKAVLGSVPQIRKAFIDIQVHLLR